MKPTGEGRKNQHDKGCVIKISASFFVQTPEETLCSTILNILCQHHIKESHGSWEGTVGAWEA